MIASIGQIRKTKYGDFKSTKQDFFYNGFISKTINNFYTYMVSLLHLTCGQQRLAKLCTANTPTGMSL